jgi:hypothetical protein
VGAPVRDIQSIWTADYSLITVVPAQREARRDWRCASMYAGAYRDQQA